LNQLIIGFYEGRRKELVGTWQSTTFSPQNSTSTAGFTMLLPFTVINRLRKG
jgi:hypothetical protein